MKEYYAYIVISQTGTILSRILKTTTKATYNHASISIDPNLNELFSFGRVHPYNPFWGGFVKESPNYGTFKRFSNTKIEVIKIPINKTTYKCIENMLNKMYQNKKNYGYNYLGLFLAALHIQYKCVNRYYCSEFVKAILLSTNINSLDNFSKITKPIDLEKLYKNNIVYIGTFQEYQKKVGQQIA